jgi:hypothetical protein
MKNIVLAMHNYESAHKKFPEGSGAQFGTGLPNTNLYLSAFATTLPYIEQENLQDLIDQSRPWEQQTAQVASTNVASFVCPSNVGKSPELDLEFGALASALGLPIGSIYGATTYVLSKGANFRWCNKPATLINRGMFDLGLTTRFADITDGSSNTFCLGEGATGGNWKICEGQGCIGPPAPSNAGGDAIAFQAWLVPQPNSSTFKSMGLSPRASIFAATNDKMNKNPVTETLVDDGGFDGSAGGTVADGDSTSNFRSNHPQGCNFGLADGSIQYITESIDALTYQGLSTIQGGEIVSIDD